MTYNANSSYGRANLDALYSAMQKSPLGRVFVVGKAGIARRDILEQIYKPAEGQMRVLEDIKTAVALCTAGAGDVIAVLPGHTETLSSATALALNVADVSIVGLGEGTSMPKITMDTGTTTTIPVSVANVTIENVIFSANFADIVSAFTLTTAKNFKLVGCKFEATATNMNFVSIVTTSTTNNAADGLTIEGCSWIEPDLATKYLVSGLADIDQIKISGNYVNLGVNTSDLPALVNMATGKDLSNAVIGGKTPSEGNVVIRLNDANPLLVVTDTTTANTGFVANNFVKHADTAGELLVTAATKFGFFENKATAVDDFSGFILPAVDS